MSSNLLAIDPNANPKEEDLARFEWPKNSAMWLEEKRWNTPKRNGGMNANGYEEFPKQVFKARRHEDGGPYFVIDPKDEKWSQGSYHDCKDENEYENYLKNGWSKSSQEALEFANLEDDRIARAAAERHAADKKLSRLARAEVLEKDRQAENHVGDHPATPIPAKRKYTRKASPLSA